MIIYNVNEKKGTVVARFDGGKEYWRESLEGMLDRIFERDGAFMLPPYHIVSEILDDVTDFVGKAKLYPGDTFNKEVGMDIAKERLNAKFNRVKDRVLKDTHDYIDAVYDDIRDRLHSKWFK